MPESHHSTRNDHAFERTHPEHRCNVKNMKNRRKQMRDRECLMR